MPKNINCPICGEELRFIEYRTKKGKDGRTAKWPVYEKCPNVGTDKHRVSKRTPDPDRPYRKPSGNMLDSTPGAVQKAEGWFKMYQLPNLTDPIGRTKQAIEKYKAKYGIWPTVVWADPDLFDLLASKEDLQSEKDIVRHQITIEANDNGDISILKPATFLTRGFRYLAIPRPEGRR